MPPKRKTQAHDSETLSNDQHQSQTSQHKDEHDEAALDPKLAESPDEPEQDTSKRPSKRRKAYYTKTENQDSLPAKDDSSSAWKRNDFNPKLTTDATPLQSLQDALDKHAASRTSNADDGANVVFWMRMRDLRIHDNRALAHASALAEEQRQKGKGGNLVALFILSPGDYQAHDRGPRRIDFVLRTLRELKTSFDLLNIPLVVLTVEPRTTIPDKVLDLCKQWNASQLCANIEYEVDELWRDAKIVQQANECNLSFSLFHDCYVVPPGLVNTLQGKPYSVFSPWNKRWTETISKDPSLLDESPDPQPNPKSIQSDSHLGTLFQLDQLGKHYGIPDQLPGFECQDRETMAQLWPVSDDAAARILDKFIQGQSGKRVLDSAADEPDTQDVGPYAKNSRLGQYKDSRNLMCENGTSRLSPYLAAGLVSARECLRRTKALTKDRLEVSRETGAGMWNIEVAFRDFYGHVLAAWPKVCMGHAFITKYEDVQWETDTETLQAWQQGKTGYPIVDAAQQQCVQQGYIHNRGRMISAMFLTKHLLHDWRQGERFFNHHFVDQDLASNNGGWQWSASTGTDPQPYFRIFNPLSQSEKSDPQGDYIRHFVPELSNVKGKAIHDPYGRLPKKEFEKLGYPKPIVEHTFARQRALRRYKNPGEE